MATDAVQFDLTGAKRVANATRWVERTRNLGGGERGKGNSTPLNWRPFVNNASSEIPPHGIVKITGITADNGDPFLAVDRPGNTFGILHAVNGPLPIAANKAGRCLLEGPLRLAYDTGSPAFGDGYGPKPGQWEASKNYPQLATCLGVITTNPKLIYATFQQITTLIGKTTATNTKASGSGGTVEIYQSVTPGSGEATVNASCTVTAYNRYATVASGKWVVLSLINGRWYIITAEC